MRHRKTPGGTDHLVAESEKLRGELLKTAARVALFTEHLALDARELSEEAAHKEGSDNDRADTGDPGTEDEPGPGPAAH